MEVTLEPMDPTKVRRSYRSMAPLHDKIREIIENPQNHEKWLVIAKFPRPIEKGLAAKTRQNLMREWGNDPAIAGVSFTWVVSTNDREEYLTCYYDPNDIVPGLYAEFREAAERKKEARKAKRVGEAA